MKEPIKIALPKGRLLADTASLLQKAEWGINDYNEATRLYHLKSDRFTNLTAKIFHEKDIPVQVSIGNYDLGICGSDWIEELLSKYPASPIVKIKELGYGAGNLAIVGASVDALTTKGGSKSVRIASEYPNLAESFAGQNRLRKFSVFPVWGAAQAYPPEDAEAALVSLDSSLSATLIMLAPVLEYGAYLIANKRSWETKEMSILLSGLTTINTLVKPKMFINIKPISFSYSRNDNLLRVALPDGHQHVPTEKLLNKAGIKVEGYSSSGPERRPSTDMENVSFKVIRPQDMPLQVANGNFDLAITGKDWLRNHLYQFPSSPVIELLDLKYGWVRIVAAAHHSLGVSNVGDLRKYCRNHDETIRLASEYVNIADKYARENHLGMYRVIPTWGATESFLPDDADLLIENTETGRTLARHNLDIIDTLFESTACLICSTDKSSNPLKKAAAHKIVTSLRAALESD